MSCLSNSVDPDQLASEEANRSGSTQFAIQYLNLYQQHGSDWQKIKSVCVEVLRPSQPVGSCRARSVYLTTRLLGRLSPLSG